MNPELKPELTPPRIVWLRWLVLAGLCLLLAGGAVPTARAAVLVAAGGVTSPIVELPRLLPNIRGYTVYTVREGDTLASIAAAAGSTPYLIWGYNHLQRAPLPGRALILPVLEGYTNTLPFEPVLITAGREDLPMVALTLDAGAGSAPTPAMLDALRERDIQITFFLTARWVWDNPELVRQIVADGHELANHSATHADFRELTDAEIIAELAAVEEAVFAVAGASARPYFRPPFGAYDQRVLRVLIEQGYLPIYWTLDSLDSVGEPKTPEFLADRMTGSGMYAPEQMYGTIILAHCGSEPTGVALPTVLDRYAAMGIKVTTISEVLGQ